MGAFFTAFLLAVGAGAWVFSRLQQRTGYGNSRSAIIGAGVATLSIFLVAYTIARMIGL